MVSFFGTDTSPSSALLADDHAEERGLAGAVRADEADLLAGIELERGVDEGCPLSVVRCPLSVVRCPVRGSGLGHRTRYTPLATPSQATDNGLMGERH